MDADLTLRDRFVLTALTDDEGQSVNQLLKWSWPIRLEIIADQQFRTDIEQHAQRLGQLASQPVRTVRTWPNMIVEISDRETASNCRADLFGSPRRWRAEIHIWSQLPEQEIRRCIVQEMTQAMGPGGDLDGTFGSRTDTVFASYQSVDRLTDQDLAVLRILYDPRLYSGMPRDDVLAILPEIVADVEAELAMRSQ